MGAFQSPCKNIMMLIYGQIDEYKKESWGCKLHKVLKYDLCWFLIMQENSP